jgi:hypothetical protein
MTQPDHARRTGPALEAMYRFLLGDRIECTSLDVLERLIEATYTRERRGPLQQANLGLTKRRHLLRYSGRVHNRYRIALRVRRGSRA